MTDQPNHLSPVDRRRMIERGTAQLLSEWTTAGMDLADAAKALAREAALHHRAYAGTERTVTALRDVVGELEGVG